MRVRRAGAVVVLAAIIAGCGAAQPTGQQPTGRQPSASLPVIDELPDANGDVRATLLRPVNPRWEPGPAGDPMMDEFGENPAILEAPAELLVLGEPVVMGASSWVRVYVLPDQSRWPSDFFTWIPTTDEAGPVLALHGSEQCPAAASVDAMATLSYMARAGCFGDEEIVLDGVTWFGGESEYHRVQPEWLGADFEHPVSVALHAGTDERAFGVVQLPSINVHFPDGVPVPPYDFRLRVSGRLNHPEAAGCERHVDRSFFVGAPPGSGLTEATAEESDLWCRGHFVASSWEVLSGPEGRPLRPGDAQLHRTPFEGAPCAGVGMEPMVFRVDPTELDPVWLETESGRRRVLPVFGVGFRVQNEPELAVLAPAPDDTVVARDGQPMDPDASLFGYPVCPMGEVVSITSR